MDEILSRLKAELKSAVRLHYQRLTLEFDDIYGYGLYTVDDIPMIGPVANRESTLPGTSQDYRYFAVEWTERDDFGLFREFNDILNEIHHLDEDFAEKRNLF